MLLEDQRMEKLALSGALSGFSKSWECVRSLRFLWRGWDRGRQTLLMAGGLQADELLGQLDPLTLGVQVLWTHKTSKDLPHASSTKVSKAWSPQLMTGG